MNLSRRQFLKGAGAAAALTLAPAFAFAEESKTLRTTGADERITDELLEVRELPEPPAVWRDAVDKAPNLRGVQPALQRRARRPAHRLAGERVFKPNAPPA